MEDMAASSISAGTAVAAPRRVLSVDMLRGITIALMIMVNDAGDWEHVFGQLDHAKWNGWTLTDLVFPTFLFLMGASIVFSMRSREAKGDCNPTQVGHIFLRFAKLVVLALMLAYFPRMHWTMRIYGVLMRIALCYLIAALILLAVPAAHRVRVLLAIVLTLLVGYWVLLRFAPVPGAGHPVRDFPLLDPMWNLTAWLDRCVSGFLLKWLHTGTLYQKTRDPEGLLSTLPAVASVLLGALAGMWMRRPQSDRRMQRGLALAGAVGVVAGEVWEIWFPINKNLWTSSYVLLAAGLAALLLALCSRLVDQREQPWPRWLRRMTWPWFVFGSNSIVAYTASEALEKVGSSLKIADAEGDRHSLWALTYENVFARHGSNEWTSLAFAASYVVVCFVPVWLLWRKRIFLKM